MSRTDAHAPLYVRLHRRELAAEPVHTCAGGTCDLPDQPPADRGWRPHTACHWSFTYTGVNVCSCELCHCGALHRQDRRSERRRVRVLVGEVTKAWTGGDRSAFDDLATRA